MMAAAVAILIFVATVTARAQSRADHDGVFSIRLDGREIDRVAGSVLASGDVYPVRLGPNARAEVRMTWDSHLGHVLELLLRIGDVARIVRGMPYRVQAEVGRQRLVVEIVNE
jgi:hypothetical protein